MTELKKNIEIWEKEMLSPSKLDVLVNCQVGKKAIAISADNWSQRTFELPASQQLLSIITTAKATERESGVSPLTVSAQLISFSLEDKTYNTPLFFQSVKAYHNRLNQTVRFEQKEDLFVNPFLEKLIDLELPTDETKAIEQLKKSGLAFHIEQLYFLANFHPHRFFLFKELTLLKQELRKQTPLTAIFGRETQTSELRLTPSCLFPADPSQIDTLSAFDKENIVLQGPPGTGKSQVITNLLGKVLDAEKNALVLAEKQTALAVIFEKLKTKELHHFALPFHHQINGKELYQNLKKTWLFLEESTHKENSYISLANLKRTKVERALSMLIQKQVIGGLSLLDFYEKYAPIKERNHELLDIDSAPDFPVWEKDKNKLLSLQEPIGDWILVSFSEKHKEKGFLTKLNQALDALKQLSIRLISKRELEEKRRLYALSKLFFFRESPLPREYILGASKEKQLKAFINKWTYLEEKIELLSKEKEAWKKELNWSEIADYIAALSSTNRWNIRTWRKRKELFKFTQLDFSGALVALKKLEELKTLELEFVELKKELRNEGLPDNLIELNHIQFVQQQLKQVAENRIKHLSNCTESELRELQEKEQYIDLILDFVRNYSCISPEADVVTFLEHCKKDYTSILTHIGLLSTVSSVSKSIIYNAGNIEKAERAIVAYHWKRFVGYYPDYVHFSGDDIIQMVNDWNTSLQSDEDLFARSIQQKFTAQFHAYHQLLQTPARKLNATQKELKKTLRKGKAILVKEFSKSRQHLSLLELLESEAKVWVNILKPIVLASPYSIARSFPLHPKLFDVLVIDEASQMPLAHAAGALFRSSRVLIAGDEQQMAPSPYHSTHGKTSNSVDVLHQASFYWKNKKLLFHYRSESPSLMAFSNQYFYNNELFLFPSVENYSPIEVVTLKGIYDNRVNQTEAEWIAKNIVKKINQQDYNFGVVAFSQVQLDAIFNALPIQAQEEIINEERGILWTSLEELQGEECDHLYVSLGYAKNPEGKLFHRFGALNHVNGHKRLNVLMSRAKNALTFVRSISAEDLSISENEGVDVLRKLLLFLENDVANHTEKQISPNMVKNGDKIILTPNFIKSLSSPEELLTIVTNLKKRNWKVEIDLCR